MIQQRAANTKNLPGYSALQSSALLVPSQVGLIIIQPEMLCLFDGQLCASTGQGDEDEKH